VDVLIKMKKITLIIFSILLIGIMCGMVNAESTNDYLGTFKSGECIQLYQICDTCSYVNLTSIIKSGDNPITTSIGLFMEKSGYDYNYTYCPSSIGDYKYNMIGDKDGTATQETIDFSVTPSGNGGTPANIAFFILVILLVYGITLVGYLKTDYYITILGSMAMLFLGIYLFNNGIIIFRDDLTKYVSYLTIGLGAIISVVMSILIIQDNM
jgi:hypothetical protein